MNPPLVALDIGSTKVACAIGLPRERSAGFELLGASVVPYPLLAESWLSDPLLVSRTIEQALEATAVTGDFHRALVAINPPLSTSERIRASITLADEPMTVRTHDLERLQRSALDQALGIDREPLLVERLSCSGNGFEGVRDPRGLAATRLLGTFHIVTMPMAARRAATQAVESAGLEVASLSHPLPAVLAGVGDEELFRKRVVVIDASGLTTEVGCFVEGVLTALEIAPVGGVRLAMAVAKRLQVTVEQATAWSLEGTSCRKPEVRKLVEAHWSLVQAAMERILADQLRPDQVLVTGRGALIDGFVEWVERAGGMSASLARGERTPKAADLTRQVGLSAAIGLLEAATRGQAGAAARPARLFNRLVHHTRTILTEYF
ncbi:MAG: hypothetical protein HY599_05125 [Candidatus Omnitrophica bacterium]|nr:hypothetical protein [Candidatus Omnitrophota bacterium]